MNEKALRVLEYHKITDQLAQHATTPMGREACLALVPMDSLESIKKAQKETEDALKRILSRGSVSFSGVKDIRDTLMRLHVGSSLGAPELLRINAVLRVAARARSFGCRDLPEEEYDSLDEKFQSLQTISALGREIDRCIISEEDISDDASPALRSIRRSMALANEKIHSQLNSMLNSSRAYLQDAVITMRNGRYCVPVKNEYRSQVAGMIHDQSSSGSTVFVEPMAVVKLNNELRELEIKEQKEIEVILAALSELAAQHEEELQEDLNILTELDFIFAKASLAKVQKASAPLFNDRGYINIKKGRHPLLPGDKVVPIDIHLGKEFDLLIVTGPNTGGKTVSLKTVGLFTLMGQAGLHIPAFDGSELALFTEVYADIGDEQSIEQSLSTFSSHMTNIVSILEEADDRSLVLFDELGAGTDPTEGAALAISILSFLHNMQVRAMATTHYSELKIFALSTPGVENACCEFDVETLRPTYRLLIGIPGKSNAFAISRKLGLPEYIIEDAKKRIDAEAESFEDVISNLEKSRIRMEQEQAELERLRKETDSLKSSLAAREERLESQKAKILEEANEKARQVLQDAKDFADQTIKTINKHTSDGETGRILEQERTRLREKLTGVESKLVRKPQKPKKKVSPKELKIGDAVKVLSMNVKGTVSSLPDSRGELYVQMGILRSKVKLDDLEPVQESTISGDGVQQAGLASKYAGKSLEKGSASQMRMSKSASISPEVNLIGMTVDEAIPELDKYLDDAYLSHLEQVRVVHGRGTGALRSGVHNHLRRLKYVKSFRLGNYGEGDTGVTIVEFK